MLKFGPKVPYDKRITKIEKNCTKIDYLINYSLYSIFNQIRGKSNLLTQLYDLNEVSLISEIPIFHLEILSHHSSGHARLSSVLQGECHFANRRKGMTG